MGRVQVQQKTPLQDATTLWEPVHRVGGWLRLLLEFVQLLHKPRLAARSLILVDDALLSCLVQGGLCLLYGLTRLFHVAFFDQTPSFPICRAGSTSMDLVNGFLAP